MNLTANDPIAELTNMLFGKHPVRIYKEMDRILFVANDVASILGIANVSDAVSKMEDYEKSGVAITDPHGRVQNTTVLTDAGLYSLILKSRKPIAREFRKWVLTEVLPSIQKTGGYTTSQKELEDKLEASELETIAVKEELKAIKSLYEPEYSPIDTTELLNRPVIYLFKIDEFLYKYGKTTDIRTRRSKHRGTFGSEIKLVGCWPCVNSDAMAEAENILKEHVQHNNIDFRHKDQIEIIKTGDFDSLVKIISRIIATVNEKHKAGSVAEIIKLEIEKFDKETNKIKEENEHLRLQIKLYKLINYPRPQPTIQPAVKPNPTDRQNIDPINIPQDVPNPTDRQNIDHIGIPAPAINQPANPPQIVDKSVNKTIAWIRQHPPADMSMDEYRGACNAATGIKVGRIAFGDLMHDEGYKKNKSPKKRTWVLK